MRTSMIILVALTTSAAADNDDSVYRAQDAARVAIITALDSGDTATFASYVGAPFETRDLWFDSATCRKKFASGKVKAKDARAFATCFKGLKVWAQGLTIQYGPGVSAGATFNVVDGKVTIKSMSGPYALEKTLPNVGRKTFEANRIEGELKVTLDDTARAELADAGESGVAFDVCVDKTGRVSKIIVMPVIDANGPTAKQIRASTKSWRFKPFIVRGKPAPVCGTEIAKPTGELKL